MKKIIVFLLVIVVVLASVFFLTKLLATDVQDETTKIENHTHTPGDEKIENEVAATCTTGGSYDKVVYCKDCNSELSRVTELTSALGHTNGAPAVENRVEATCTTAGGYDTVVRCTVCNEVITSEHTAEASLGHTNGAPAEENRVEATCTTSGGYDTVVRCTVCNEIITSEHTEEASFGHTNGAPAIENEVAATCMTAGGYDTVVRCAVCNEVITSEHTEEASFGHTKGAPAEENRVEATATTHGSYNIVERCTVCGEVVTSEAVTLHYAADAVVENKVVSTSCAILGGYDTVVYCSVDGCGAELSCVRTNQAPAHNFVDGACSACGASDGFTYELDDETGTCWISDFKRSLAASSDVIVPATYTVGSKTYRVEGIGPKSSSSRGIITNNVTSVVVQEGVSYIGFKAFYLTYDCQITSIKLPDSITKIYNQAFYGPKITEIYISKNVQSIDKNAFYACSTLQTVYYGGTSEEWEAKFSSGEFSSTNNEYLRNADIWFYSEGTPTEAGNFWHYVDGVITKWPAA